jgi:hypothetical protein
MSDHIYRWCEICDVSQVFTNSYKVVVALYIGVYITHMFHSDSYRRVCTTCGSSLNSSISVSFMIPILYCTFTVVCYICMLYLCILMSNIIFHNFYRANLVKSPLGIQNGIVCFIISHITRFHFVIGTLKQWIKLHNNPPGSVVCHTQLPSV